MKPLYLSIQGLFSYRNQVEIDFVPLTEAGLFGIFGPVGSGKSTILDAMTLALYGESDRLSAQDRRNYNLMNLQSNELKIRFRFLHDGDDYLFTVEGSRHSKRYDEVKSFKRRAYRIENGEPLALNDDNRAFSAQEILGISYDNFRRTIIIPQGRFQEFLQLTPGKRRNMMKELFGLEKYDLMNPTSALLQTAKQQLSGVEGSLELLEDATEETLQEIRGQTAAADEQSRALLAEKTAARQRVQELDQSAELFERLAAARQEMQALEAQRETVDRQREWLQRYEECRRRFESRLQSIDERIRAYRKISDSEQSARQQREALEQTHGVHRQQFSELSSTYGRKDAIDAEAAQLEALAAQKDLLKEQAELAGQQSELDGQQAGVQTEIEELQSERAELKQRIEQLQSETALFDDLHEIAEWYSERKNLLQQSRDLESRIEQQRREAEQQATVLQTAAADIEARAGAAAGAVAGADTGAVADSDSGVSERLSTLAAELGALYREVKGAGELPEGGSLEAEPHIRQLFEAAERAVQSALDQLRRFALSADSRQLILTLSRQLQSDTPCPVCGSLQHPAPAYRQAAAEQTGTEQERAREDCISLLEKLRSHLIQHKTACSSSLSFIYSRLNEISRLRESRAKLDSRLTAQLEEFRWPQYSPTDDSAFKAGHASAQNARSQAADANSRLQQLEERIEKLNNELSKYRTKVQQFEQQHAVLKHRLKETASQVPDELHSEYEMSDSAALSEQAAELRAEVQRVETEYRKLEKQLHEDEIALRSAEATEQERRLQRETAVEQIRQAAVEAAGNLRPSEFASMRVVKQLLSVDVDVEELRSEIEAYSQKYTQVREKLNELTERTQDIEYSPEAHQSARERARQLDEEYEQLLNTRGRLQQQVEAMERDLRRKTELQQQKQRLDERIENLNELFRLFKGQGFVNFVATRYLHDLCARANERFFQLTRKQLRLEINEENDFVIRDYLNGGRIRSVKTLSGGQLFQASFSLALALADSIHQNKESFFFLDEGFGSLDRRSLQEVFDTLKSLRKENRIVGVISHVEELREEIPVSLQVSEDPDAGSRIASSI
ncbi:MAG: AAA family ATPase [Spirochaetota bacterium]